MSRHYRPSFGVYLLLPLLLFAIIILSVTAAPAAAETDSRIAAVYPLPSHTFILTEGGSLWAWGNNQYGKLGDGTTVSRSIPILLLENVSDLYPQSSGHTFALKDDGSLWAWERNWDGRIGAGSSEAEHPAPIRILDQVAELFPGERHSFALKNDGSLWGWGHNSSGQLGDGTRANRFEPILIELDNVITVFPHLDNTFALLEDGSLWAWGDNRYGKLGDGSAFNRYRPVLILRDVETVYPQDTHTLAKKTDQTVWAWGYNWYGQLGDGSGKNQRLPVQARIESVKEIYPQKFHSFALKDDGSLWGWGYNWYGQLGDGSIANRNEPIRVPVEGVADIYPQQYHTFMLGEDSTLWGWGRSWDSRLGEPGSAHLRSNPVRIAEGISSAFIRDRHGFALDIDGLPLAWGNNDKGQLGSGSFSGLITPTAIPLDNVTEIFPQEDHTFALKEDGSLWAWGNNTRGQLGIGNYQRQSIPVQVLLGDDLPTYAISLTADPREGGSLSGSGTYRRGESVTITVRVNPGYTFANWTEDGETAGTETNLSFLAVRDRHLVANFTVRDQAPPEETPEDPEIFEIKLQASPGEGGKVSGGGSFASGTEITVKAEQAEGYTFINWTENDKPVSENAGYSFPVEKNRLLTANFKADEEEPGPEFYQITLNSIPEEGGAVEGAGSYEEGTEVAIRATAAEGYRFKAWIELISKKELSGRGQVTTVTETVVSEKAEYSFTAERDRRLIATFQSLEDESNPAELLRISAENGNIMAVFDRELEEAPHLTAFSAEYRSETTGDEPETNNSSEESEDAAEWKNLDLVNILWDQGKGDQAVLNFEPFEPGEAEKSYTVKLTYLEKSSAEAEPFKVEAAASAPSFNIDLAANPEAGGFVSGEGTFSEGAEVIVSAEAAEGYIFVNWTEDGDEAGTEPDYSFKAERDRTLTANFKIVEAIITTIDARNGEIVITFDREPNEDPETGDFTVHYIKEAGSGDNNGIWKPLMVMLEEPGPDDDPASALFSYQPFAATDEQAYYTIKIMYRENPGVTSNSFFVEAVPTFQLTLETSPVEGGMVSGDGIYREEDQALISARANDGYLFIKWSAPDGAAEYTEPEFDYIMPADDTVLVAFFEINENQEKEPEESESGPYDLYYIEAAFDPANSGTVHGEGFYESGEKAVLVAVPEPGYSFDRWKDEENTAGFDQVLEFNVTRDLTLTAVFLPDDGKDIFDIVLYTEPDGEGFVQGEGLYSRGEVALVRAIAGPGYEFANWKEDGLAVSPDSEYSFTVSANRNLTAQFKAEDPAGGKGNGENESGNDREESNHDSGGENGPDKGRDAENEDRLFTVTLIAEPEHSGEVSGSGEYQAGELAGLNAFPAEGFEFVNWMEDDQEISMAKTYAFSVSGDRTLTAAFRPLTDRQNEIAETYLISLAPVPLEGGRVYGSGEYTEGEMITVSALPNNDYHFVNWTDNGIAVSADIIYSFVVEDESRLVANFAPLFSVQKYSVPDSEFDFARFMAGYFADFLAPNPAFYSENGINPGSALTGWTGFGLPPMGGADY
jgi:alpha-tubulin suppressor-like RCC1 family protein